MTRFRSLDRAAYVVAATALSAVLLASPAGAAAPGPTQAAPTQRPNTGRVTIHNVDEWIAYLQDHLHITQAETAQWNAVAQVMRENAESIHRLVQERNQNQKTMNAIDDLRSYEQLTAA